MRDGKLVFAFFAGLACGIIPFVMLQGADSELRDEQSQEPPRAFRTRIPSTKHRNNSHTLVNESTGVSPRRNGTEKEQRPEEVGSEETPRDPDKKINYAQRLENWEDFYAATRALKLINTEYERLIINRIRVELGLSRDKLRSLEDWIEVEQDSVTEEAITKWGSGNKLREMAGSSGPESRKFWTELRALREDVRRRYDPEFASRFTHHELSVINEHLRNEPIFILSASHDPEYKVRVWGVGK